jgi:hypothetical protein
MVQGQSSGYLSSNLGKSDEKEVLLPSRNSSFDFEF